MATNRDNTLIAVALGRISIEDCKFELTEWDYKLIAEVREKLRKAKEEGRVIIFYAPESYEDQKN